MPDHCELWSLLLHVATVILAPHNFEYNPRQVLGAAALHEDHMVLPQGVALPGRKQMAFFACAEEHLAALALGRGGLLWFSDKCAQHHTLLLWPALCGTQMLRGFLPASSLSDVSGSRWPWNLWPRVGGPRTRPGLRDLVRPRRRLGQHIWRYGASLTNLAVS